MASISAETRKELLRAIADRYRQATKSEKRRILDEFVALTGFHRKHAIRVLAAPEPLHNVAPRRRPRLYEEAVRQALIVLWEASDRICGKRLRPLLPILVPALERHGHLSLDAVVRTQLLKVSAATIDRALSGPRMAANGKRSRAKGRPAIRKLIPVRTFADWNEPAPGFMEIDLVARCGGTMAGSFAHTLVLTDIASGWTECVALLVREGSLVVDGIERMRTAMPFASLDGATAPSTLTVASSPGSRGGANESTYVKPASGTTRS